MNKKFAEEEYRAIAKAGDKAANEVFGLIDSRVDFEELLRMEAPNQDNVFYPEFTLYNQQIMAIANPLTRDWAHEQFVEKEKKYYWTTKNKDKNGNVMYLKRDPSGSIERVPHAFHGENERLTEPEVIAEGYNPDYYEKEEVE
ncbi:hypothetical protein LMG30237_ALEAABJJ_01633 [Fructobacillus tropaeoli]|nr:hypothetical protein LMG30237_ALEAABJJ_01633 [Fructobacillus tropaeoli]